MLSVSSIKPLNRWDYSAIRPGAVGSVGDVLQTIRLKSSLPGNFNWDASTYGNLESLHGSNVQDGLHKSFTSGGGPARLRDTNWPLNRSFKIAHAWVHQDLRAPDRSIEPVMGAQPQYSWRNKIAVVNRAQYTGNLFARDGPGVIPPTGPLRGGQYPRVTDVVGGDPVGAPDGISSGPDLVAPNFHPAKSFYTQSRHLSAKSGVEPNVREQKRPTIGRINR